MIINSLGKKGEQALRQREKRAKVAQPINQLRIMGMLSLGKEAKTILVINLQQLLKICQTKKTWLGLKPRIIWHRVSQTMCRVRFEA